MTPISEIVSDIEKQIKALKYDYSDRDLLDKKDWDMQLGVLITGEQAIEILKAVKGK